MNMLPQRVLAAVDGSLASLHAVRLAIALAASWGAAVRAVAVADAESVERFPEMAGPVGPSARERRMVQLRDALDYAQRLAGEAGVEMEALLREAGPAQPYEVLLREAELWGAELLFLGRSEHRGIGRALLGSQAEHVLEFARLPVVLVPDPAPPIAAPAGSRASRPSAS